MAKKEIYDLKDLFEDVQMNAVLEDGKTFVDCIPRLSLEEIEERYNNEKRSANFDTKKFVLDNFNLPAAYGASYQADIKRPVEEHIRALWEVLTREPAGEDSSLLNLPFTYIVPGGRFREIYYWDSFFTMLGLREHGRTDLIESMLDNFAYMINTYGHIPNGNRVYYLSRSQPPFFALMVSLLADIKNDEAIYTRYSNELEREYCFWLKGRKTTKPSKANLRVVQMPGGEILNRYFDDNPQPRQESYKEDVHVANESKRQAALVYTDLRAGAESGWDFSSRWFADGQNISTIQTTAIVPVDLNCLLYTLERTISKAKKLAGDVNGSQEFDNKAVTREKAILQYCWNEKEQFFCDYNFDTGQQMNNITAAGLFPLFVNIAREDQAKYVAQTTEKLLLKKGGLVTTTMYTGQQWDAPNGWAPLQWIAVKGLENYGHNALAQNIAGRWLSLNEKVYAATGKLMEKYNVEDISKESGGGEYPAQDGFGWTNGVYLALQKTYGNSQAQLQEERS